MKLSCLINFVYSICFSLIFWSCNIEKVTKQEDNGIKDSLCAKATDSDDMFTVFDCSKGERVSLQIAPTTSTDMQSWLDIADPEELLVLSKRTVVLANKYNLNKWGFLFSLKRDDNFITIESSFSKKKNGKARITLDLPSPADPASDFKPYINAGINYARRDAKERAVRESAQTVSFYLKGHSRYITPRKNYLTFYHFAKDATDDEIKDFWTHVVSEFFQHKHLKGPFTITSGTLHGQTIGHFYLKMD